MSQQSLETRVSRLENETVSIYELFDELRTASIRHDRQLRAITKRLDEHDRRFDGIDGRLDGIDGRLDGLSDQMTEVLEILRAR